MFNLGVFAIIMQGNTHVLLCHRRDHDLWNLPGGRLEPGEAPWEGVVREVREETGLKVEVVRLAGVYSKPQVNEVVFSFLCSVAGGTLKTTEEADRVEFFPARFLPDNTIPKQAERIRDALETPHDLVMKVQRGESSLEFLRRRSEPREQETR